MFNKTLAVWLLAKIAGDQAAAIAGLPDDWRIDKVYRTRGSICVMTLKKGSDKIEVAGVDRADALATARHVIDRDWR